MGERSLAEELEQRVEDLGYEFIDLETAGNSFRPILRLRIDRPGSEPGTGVTLDDCTRVSRALEEHLDVRADLSEHYVLEVSSPGVERPLVRRRDWDRFAGREVALRGKTPLAGRARRLEGTLLGLAGEEDGDERVRIRLESGEEIEVPRAEITQAHLIYRWGEEGRER